MLPAWYGVESDDTLYTLLMNANLERFNDPHLAQLEDRLVELLRDLPVASYRLRAELRHQDSDPRSGPYHGYVGLFLGHQAASASPKTPHIRRLRKIGV